MTAPRHEYYLVIDRDGCIRADTVPMSFDTIVKDIRDGQYKDVDRVVCLTLPHPKWPHAEPPKDVTLKVACALAANAYDHPLTPGSTAYRLVEEQLSCDVAHRARERVA